MQSRRCRDHIKGTIM